MTAHTGDNALIDETIPRAPTRAHPHHSATQLRAVRLIPACISLAALAVFSSSALAAKADASMGKAKFAVCASCHGADGRTPSGPAFPKIGGLKADYVEKALHAYKSGSRTGGMATTMQSMAKPLSDSDIQNLAAYISSLGPK